MKNRIYPGSFCFLFILFLIHPHTAWAYFDPGSGGYLISSVLAGLGSILAFIAAFIIHFFRNILGRRIRTIWRRYRLLSVIFIVVVITAAGGWVYDKLHYAAIKKFDPSLSGAHIIDAKRITPGYDLYRGMLIDEYGHELKKWSAVYLGVIDRNGDYYGQKHFERNVGRYTWNDKIVWERSFPSQHEILLTQKGTIITFTKDVHIYNGRPVECDVIAELSKEDGHELWRYSIWDHLKEFHQFHGMFALDLPSFVPIPLVVPMDPSVWGARNYEYYHLNSFQLLPKTALGLRDRRFREGNWLISFRHGSMISILDQDNHHIVWKCVAGDIPDDLQGQHGPTMLDNGNILIFDNGRYRKWSRVIELDPTTLKIIWEYRAKGFFSLSQGYAQRFANGNTLITDSESGRAFEVTHDGKIVWEYYTPQIQSKGESREKRKWGTRREIYRMIRYPPSMIDPLLKGINT